MSMPLPPALPSFTADCANCAGLCCMALAFDRGEDFALDKPAQTPCPNLSADFTCAIHTDLAAKGFSGCQRYECLGAGQRVTQQVFKGQNWRDDPALITPMADAFATLRRIHRDLELLLAARALPLPANKSTELTALLDAHLPDEGWTPQTLSLFAVSGTARRVAAFLQSLRSHV